MARSTGSKSGRIRYAVVGLGHIAQIAVLPAFAHAKRNSVLQAIVSGDDEKLAAVGDRYDVPTRLRYDDFDRCLGEVDAIYIATPNTEHARFAIRAADAGVNVLCEKPLATTSEECLQIVHTCRDANVKVMTAYRLHFEPLTIEVLEFVRGGRIGVPRYFSSEFSMRAKPGNIRTMRHTGGGTLYDLGVYCINAARMAFESEPTQVFAYSINGARSGFKEVDDTTSAVLHFAEDRLATFTTSFAAADVSSYRVVGTEGDILVQPAYEYAEPLGYTLTVDGKAKKKRGKKHDQFAAELVYFSDCILENREPEPSAEEGAWDLRIIEALYESARTGEAIQLPARTPEPAPRRDQAMALPPVDKPKTVNVEEPHE